jgi:hypothetical protein
VARFGDADWRGRPEVARWLFVAYPRLREIQEWLARLSLAAAVSGSAELRALADELEAGSDRWPDWSASERLAWQDRVKAALAPLAENRGSRS